MKLDVLLIRRGIFTGKLKELMYYTLMCTRPALVAH
jgi:hypothetical protein